MINPTALHEIEAMEYSGYLSSAAVDYGVDRVVMVALLRPQRLAFNH